jgi:hypothetical protein
MKESALMSSGQKLTAVLKTSFGTVQLSRMARDMLLGALITTAGLWFVGITLAICYVVFRV